MGRHRATGGVTNSVTGTPPGQAPGATLHEPYEGFDGEGDLRFGKLVTEPYLLVAAVDEFPDRDEAVSAAADLLDDQGQ